MDNGAKTLQVHAFDAEHGVEHDCMHYSFL